MMTKYGAKPVTTKQNNLLGSYHMLFPANQVNYFHVFISLLIAICLAVVQVIASHQGHLHHHFGLSATVSPAT